MGWLYSERWPTRKDLIDHITTQTPTLKHCCTGNNLWCVHEVKGIRFVCLYLMQFHGGSFKYWGYKDVDESTGPHYFNCPLSYLEGLTEPCNDYSRDWREEVRKHHARRNRKLKVNDKIRYGGNDYQVCEVNGNAVYSVTQLPHQGLVYRLKRSQLSKVEIVT